MSQYDDDDFDYMNDGFDYDEDDFADPYDTSDFDMTGVEDNNEVNDSQSDESEASDDQNSASTPKEGKGGRYGDDSPQKPTQGAQQKNPNIFNRTRNYLNQKVDAVKAWSQNLKKALMRNPWFWVVCAAAICLIVILLIIILPGLVSGVAGAVAGGTDPENMTSNANIASEYFYGRRSIYIDDEELQNSLQLSYKQYAVEVLDLMDDNGDATLNISLPTEFDNSTEIDLNITNISIGMGNIVATGNSAYNIDFSTLYPQIEYFGLTTEQGELVNNFLTEYFTSNNLITVNNGTIDELVDSTMESEQLQYIYNRCEKVMVKDEIATEEGLTDIQQRIYVGSIYMPNKDITIETLTYAFANQNETFSTSVKVIETANNTETVHLDITLEDSGEIYDGFTTESVNLKQFSAIDANNLEEYSSGVSLFEVLKTHSQHFVKDTETNIYSWKPIDDGSLYLEFNSENEFIFTELDLTIQGAE